MSEYQYYEFRAIDKPLDARAMASLRQITSRAEITSTSLINEYHWGDFRGDPNKLMAKYFDAFLYFANWGTHRLMFKVPADAALVKTLKKYAVEHRIAIRAAGNNVVLDFESPSDCYEEEWHDWRLGGLLPLRADIMAGDLRALYLAWLSAVEYGDVDDDEAEPPLPAGLQKLSGPLQELARFLYLDPDWIATVADKSQPGPAEPSEGDLAAWIAALPGAEKDALLMQAARGEGAPLGVELMNRFRRAQRPPVGGDSTHPLRTVGELRQRFESERDMRRRQREEAAARTRQRAERRQAAQRAKHLDALVGKEDDIWHLVDHLAATKQSSSYKQAVSLLKDLFDLGRRGPSDTFSARFRALRARHSSKSAFLRRLVEAGFSK
jgi:hypothetical protein